jgi:hypothetical protein
VFCDAGWSSLVARRAHNPKVVGSNPTPATKGFSESSRKPTISWAFVLFQRTSTGLFTGLSGLFIGTYSPLAYTAYARVRGGSRRHTAVSSSRFPAGERCIGQHSACPMQLPYSTPWRRSRVGRKDKPC